MTRPILLDVDAADTDHGIVRVDQRIPLEPGARVALTLAKWLPAYHAPRGAIDLVAGLDFSVGDVRCAWLRDPLDPYRLVVTVPAAATDLRVRFQALTPTDRSQGRVMISDDMLRLDWNAVCLYPADVAVDEIDVAVSLRLPRTWTWASALVAAEVTDERIGFASTNLRRLLDSPVMAGRHAHVEVLDPAITLTIVADRPDQLPRDARVLDLHRRLIAEADALFGHRPFSRYDFLMSLSEQIGGTGLEHRASSECGVRASYFTSWDSSTTEHDLLPHEYVHAWIGKYRVPQGNLHADFSSMTDELMWVYEGLTQFYGHVLAARCGLISPAHTREAFALIFTTYDGRPGRSWRPLADTNMDPILSGRQAQPWTSWQRSEDYYSEGLLIWLEIDAMLREGTGGARSLDDFCREFFAPPASAASDPPASAYARGDIVAGLTRLLAYDWDSHLATRVDAVAPHAPYQGLSLGGYELAWQTYPSDWLDHDHRHYDYFDFTYSLGLKVGIGAKIIEVIWDGPAFRAGLARGAEIVAVGDRAYSVAALQDAIDAAQADGGTIALTIRRFDRVRRVQIEWSGGQRYPTLRAARPSPGHLDALLAPRVSPPADERR